jgi:hypothetical protein
MHKSNPCLVVMLTIALISFFSMDATAQIKNTKITEQQIIKNNAKLWFKNNFVKNNFKNPLSYKFNSIQAYPITYNDNYMIPYKEAVKTLSLVDTTDKNSKNYINIQKYNQEDSDYQKSRVVNGNNADVTWDLKRKAHKTYLIIQNDTAGLSEASYKKLQLEQAISRIPKNRLNSIEHYLIEISCYGTNTFGGLILQKYRFYYSNAGVRSSVTEID